MIRVCPKCDVPLFLVHFKNIEVDVCPTCRGIWLDAGELEELLRQTGAGADDPLLQFQKQPGVAAPKAGHLCPRCDERLREIRAGDSLTLDRCPRGHGLWFDADELAQLLSQFPASAGAAGTIAYLNEMFSLTPKR